MERHPHLATKKFSWALVGSSALGIFGFAANLVQLLGQDYEVFRHLQVHRWIAATGPTMVVAPTFGSLPQAWTMYLVFFTYMLVIVFYEWTAGMIPNPITIPGIVIGIGFNLGMGSGLLHPLKGIAVGMILWVVGELHYRVRGYEGMGLGNIKMLMMIGAFWGPSKALGALFIASFAGAAFGFWRIARDGPSTLEFGPFLALGATAIVSVPLDEWYVQLLLRH